MTTCFSGCYEYTIDFFIYSKNDKTNTPNTIWAFICRRPELVQAGYSNLSVDILLMDKMPFINRFVASPALVASRQKYDLILALRVCSADTVLPNAVQL